MITGVKESNTVWRMDTNITDFTKLYLGYPTSANYNFLYTHPQSTEGSAWNR
jgi:hypothetical protein